MTTFDLRQAKLRPGEEYRDEQEIELAPFASAAATGPCRVPAELVSSGARAHDVELAFRAASTAWSDA